MSMYVKHVEAHLFTDGVDSDEWIAVKSTLLHIVVM
jgi:hypothetical protein